MLSSFRSHGPCILVTSTEYGIALPFSSTTFFQGSVQGVFTCDEACARWVSASLYRTSRALVGVAWAMTIPPVAKILLTVVNGTAGVSDGDTIRDDCINIVYVGSLRALWGICSGTGRTW